MTIILSFGSGSCFDGTSITNKVSNKTDNDLSFFNFFGFFKMESKNLYTVSQSCCEEMPAIFLIKPVRSVAKRAPL